MSKHLRDGKFQSDKYPTCPAGKVPLSTADPMAQDLLAEYARRRTAVDLEFSADLLEALRIDGYAPETLAPPEMRGVVALERIASSVEKQTELVAGALKRLDPLYDQMQAAMAEMRDGGKPPGGSPS